MRIGIIFFIFNTFFNLKFFYGFIFKLLYIVSSDQNKNMNMLHMKKCQSLNKMTKKLLDGCRFNFEIFSCKANLYFFWVR